ncbi:MAG: CheR family methyltransferase [Alkalispirochaeta sp.]
MTQTDVTKDQDTESRQEPIDFKMVTFSLGGKDYGIDIMRVKEIAKFTQFTYVPNTAHFVRGVYNLRGDIISIIDLRLFFNLPAEQKADDSPESGLILRLENNLIGVIVDSIDKVVGISSRQVQPPHPIFGDINVKYISGVAEYDERLYIILDVDRIFRKDDEGAAETGRVSQRPIQEIGANLSEPPREKQGGTGAVAQPTSSVGPGGDDDVQLRFLADGLKAFSGFYVSPVNDRWFRERARSWITEHGSSGQEYQLKEAADAERFLSTFASRFTGAFWGDEYLESFKSVVPASEATVYNVWNPGCGGGRESYTIAAVLRKRFPGQQIKIWAGDNDLLKISNAPNLLFSLNEIPSEWSDLTVEGKNGLSFVSEVREMILFEFSDVLSAAAMPKMDLIVARDLLSYHTPEDQAKILERFDDSLKPGGVLVLGDNEEVLNTDAWEAVASTPLSVYIHR